MADDIVTRLRELAGDWDLLRELANDWDYVGLMPKDDLRVAADEIERLRVALALAVGELSTHAQYAIYSPDQLMESFLGEARRG